MVNVKNSALKIVFGNVGKISFYIPIYDNTQFILQSRLFRNFPSDCHNQYSNQNRHDCHNRINISIQNHRSQQKSEPQKKHKRDRKQQLHFSYIANIRDKYKHHPYIKRSEEHTSELQSQR